MASQWYYSRSGERFGPISAEELKRMAGAGEVLPSDLVWNETLTDWVPATRIKGLFPAGTAAQQPAPPQAASPAPGASGIGTAPAAAPPRGAPPRAAAAAPQVAASDPVHQRIAAPTGHVLDALLQAVRDMASANSLRSFASGIAQLGGFCLLAAIVLNIVLRIMMAVRSEVYSSILPSLSTALLLLGLQYVGSKLCPRIADVIRGTPTRLGSTTFLHCVAIVLIAFGFVFLINSAVTAYHASAWGLIGWGIAMFVILVYAGAAALHPGLLQIDVDNRSVSAGEEAIQVLYALMKLIAQVVPVIFGMFVIVGTERLIWALVYFIQKYGASAMAADATASFYLVAGGLAPLIGYLYFILFQLFVDLMRATLAIPSKLDVLAEIARGEESDDA